MTTTHTPLSPPGTVASGQQLPADQPPNLTPEPESPFKRPGTLRRRTLLGAMSAAGLTAWVGLPPFDPLPAQADVTNKVQRLPYAVTASSELGDEIFATSDVLISEGDELLPFLNPFSNTVEALVHHRTTNRLSWLRRDTDPQNATGWTYLDFYLDPDSVRNVKDVAIATGNGQVWALIFGDPQPYNSDDGAGGSPYWLTPLASATQWGSGWTAGSGFSSLTDPGDIKAGITKDGQLYYYFVHGDNLYKVVVTSGQLSPPEPITNNASNWSDYWFKPDTSGAYSNYILYVNPGDGLVEKVQRSVLGTTQWVTTQLDVLAEQLLWAYRTADSLGYRPGYVYQSQTGIWFNDEAGNLAHLAEADAIPANATSSRVAVWTVGGAYTVNSLDEDGTLTTAEQTDGSTWGPRLPLTAGVPGSGTGLRAVHSLPLDPTRSTLFAVGADDTLSALLLDETGWNQTQIKQGGDVTGQTITCYRLKIRIIDSSGAGVPFAQAKIGTDRLAGLWSDIGSTILIPDTPIIMTADIRGEINLSMVAEELDTAVLTAQALDGDGNATGDPLEVASDYDVRHFLGGTQPLNNLGLLKPGSLHGARDGDGNLVFPTAPADDSVYVSSFNAAIAIGTDPTNSKAAGGAKAIMLRFNGKKAELSTSQQAMAFRSGKPFPSLKREPKAASRSRTGPQAQLRFSISHTWKSIAHAVRHGVAKLTKAVFNYADQLGRWIVTIGTDITDDIDVGINDIRDAMHVVGGWFHQMGADIISGVKWLKSNALKLLSEASANAKVMQELFTAAPAQFLNVTSKIKSDIDAWLTKETNDVNALLDEIKRYAENKLFGSNQPDPQDPKNTGSSGALSAVGKSFDLISEVVNHSPGMWLYDKLSQYLPADNGPQLDYLFDNAINDLANVWADLVQTGVDTVRLIWTTMKDLQTAAAMKQKQVTEWFDQLKTVTDDAITLCRAIADTLLDLLNDAVAQLDAYLSYQWSLGAISPVLKLVLDKLGVDPTISLSRLTSLVIAYPATVIGRVFGYTSLFPASESSNRRRPTAAQADQFPSDWAIARSLLAGAAIGLGTAADIFADIESTELEEDGYGKKVRPQQRGIIDLLDILSPLATLTITWPNANDQNNHVTKPFSTGLPTTTNAWRALPFAITTALLPPAVGIINGAKRATSTGNPVELHLLPNYNPDQPQDGWKNYFSQIINALAGAANLISNSIYSARNPNPSAGITSAVIGNLPNITSPFTARWLNAETEDLPVIVKGIIDAVSGVGYVGATAAVYATSETQQQLRFRARTR